jgi:hypothetical protein
MANRLPPTSDADLRTFSHDLKRLIDQAQRLRDEINQRLNAQAAPEVSSGVRREGRRPVGRKMSSP